MQRVFVWAVLVVVLGGVGAAVAEEVQTDPRLVEVEKWNQEVNKLQQAGKYSEAIPLAERALAVQEQVLGKNHLDVTKSLNKLANLYADQGLYAQAEPLYKQALAIREVLLGKDHPDVAKALNNLANLYADRGIYAQAEPLYQRALAIREALLGKNHPSVAKSLSNLAELYVDQGLYAQAEPLYERALVIWSMLPGDNHSDLAKSLNGLASVYFYQGLYARAEPLHVRALAIREAVLGNNHPDVAGSLNNLAILYQRQGLYARAEPLHVRALAIREAVLGKNHPDVAISLNNLANLFKAQGLYARSESFYLRALRIQEAMMGMSHPLVADSLDGLATLYAAQGLYARAQPLYARALAIREAALTKNHSMLGRSLANLGMNYVRQGLYARAEPLLKRSVAISEATFGERNPDIVSGLNNLAILYAEQGLNTRAEPLYERALAISETALGTNHPIVATILHNLAQLRLMQLRLADALPLLIRAFAISEERLRQEALAFSEERRFSFLRFLRRDEEAFYTVLYSYPADPEVRSLALTAALLRKGRFTDELAGISRIISFRLEAKDRETFERLQALRTQLSEVTQKRPGNLSAAVYKQLLADLSTRGDTLEAELAMRVAPLRALTTLSSPKAIVDRVAAALPYDGVLVELIAHRNHRFISKPGTPPNVHAELRYLALVLHADGHTAAVDLGPAAPIRAAVASLRHALTDANVTDTHAAEKLYQLVMAPILPLLDGKYRLYLAPDDELNLVPFAALHDGSRYLVDTYDITYLTSGQELLPRPAGHDTPGPVVAFADPDFNARRPPAAVASPETAMAATRSASLEQFDRDRAPELHKRRWESLVGTRREAMLLQQLFPSTQLLLDDNATGSALLRVAVPRVLHIATHGFFFDAPADSQPGTRTALAWNRDIETVPAPRFLPSDPMLRAGLIGAGGSVVTALELAGMNLWGTEMVVLSACDTGQGQVEIGQGVHGLRRAFLVAGAETVVASLWRVDDGVTYELMEPFYRALVAGQGRSEAMRTAMLTVRAKHPHPRYWAPFIVVGQGGPLRAGPPR